ncbi:MAG TPA: 50S ribosomal protein L35 [bacterium]|nr:50S ribosomal protein L35 [bacterium]HPN33263.1 50S ribosomal protein L35 [bacterium]
MPKQKSNRAAKKRFRLTGTGKVRSNHSCKRHILTKKTRKRKRALRRADIIHPVDEARVKKMISA